MEQTITRHNELIDPLVHVWGWEIPVYLFLGGLVAGMMIITGYFQITRRARRMSCVCSRLPIVGIVLLTLGMVALFLDLEHKAYVWRLYTTFEPTSVMSWGAWILLLVYPVLAASMVVRPPDGLSFVAALQRGAAWFERHPALVTGVAIANLVLGVSLGIYTGILLSTLGARPLWNSSLLGPLFLLSGLSAAAAFVHVLTSDVEERALMEQADTVFLAAELAVLFLFLLGLATSTKTHADAAALLLGGEFTAVFWVLVVGLGIVVPLIIQALVVARRVHHSAMAPILVIAGGLVLRFVFVYAGQVSHWSEAAAGHLRGL